MRTWTYMNIKSQGHSLTLAQGHLDSTFSNIFSLETAWLIEAKFHVAPPWDGRTKVCLNGPGHMTNIAAMLIFFFSGTKWPMTLKFGMQHWVIEYYQVCSNDAPTLDLQTFRHQVVSAPRRFGPRRFGTNLKKFPWRFGTKAFRYQDISVPDL